MEVIAVINQKGGVGKTTSAVNIAYGMAIEGKRVLLIDADPQGHSSDSYTSFRFEYENTLSDVMSSRMFDVSLAVYPAFIDNEEVKNLSIIPSNISLALIAEQLTSRLHREKILKKAIKPIEDQYDVIIIDCPPNLGVLAINSIYYATKFLVPVKPDKRALDGVGDLFLTIDDVKEGQKYDYSMFRIDVDVRNTQTNTYIDNELKSYKNNVLKTIIRRNEAINQSYIAGKPIYLYDPKGKGTEDFKSLIKEIEYA
jgi:chromosome partitioning protein